MRLSSSLLALFSCFSLALADEAPKPEMTEEQLQAAYKQQVEQILSTVHYVEKTASLPGGIATLNLPDGYRYLSPEDAKKVVVDIWGNPPQAANDILGLIVPKGEDLSNVESWAIVATFDKSGNVSDKDADSINYDDLLTQLKEQNQATNEARKKEGYHTLTLNGWAVPPHYDKEHHVLYWAKDFANESGGDTLNYDMRVLGRRGVLSLNAVAGIGQVSDVEKATPEIISMAKFNEGHRYIDFNPKTDEVSKLGLAGLVLGGTALAAKTGLFKGIWLAILAGKKFIVMGAVAVAGFFKRLFGKKEQA